MKLPESVSEAEFLQVTEHITNILFKQFGTIHGGIDDFRQEVVIWSMAAVGKFDPASGTLGAFLHRHVRFRAMNAVRNLVRRADYPCATCHAGMPCGTDGAVCSKYRRWHARNQAKADLHRPLSLGDITGANNRLFSPDSGVEDEVAAKDLSQFIEERLPVYMVGDYLRMVAGETLKHPGRRAAVRKAVAGILQQAGLDADAERLGFDPQFLKARRVG